MANLVKKIRTDVGDLPIDYNALANLPDFNTMFSNPNLLLNSDFRNPINQRGKTTMTSQDSEWGRKYFIDRWYVQHGSSAEIKDGYISIKASSTTTESYFCQTFEKKISADNYTTTVNVKSVSGTVRLYGVQLVQGINVLHTSYELSGIDFQLMANGSVELYWVKFEYGTLSTPFVPRLYAEELIMCKRYFQTYQNDRFAVLTQTYTTATQTNGRMNLPITMRIVPNITVHSLEVKDVNNGNAITITSIEGDSVSNDAINIKGVHASTTVSPRYLYAKFSVDAEIY